MLDEYKTGKYDKVVKKLKDQYTAKDKAQKIFNIYWLEAYKNIKYNEETNLKEYINNFHNVLEKLVRDRVIIRYFQGLWFLQGLPEKTQEDMIRCSKINTKKLMIVIYKNLKALAEDSNRVSHTIFQLRKGEFCQEESGEVLGEFEGVKDSQSTTMVQPDGSSRNHHQTGVTGDLQIESLAEELQQLKVSNMRLQQQVGSMTMQPMQESHMTVPLQISRQANYSALQMNRSDWVYLDADQYKFCYERGHGMRGCPHVAQAIAD